MAIECVEILTYEKSATEIGETRKRNREEARTRRTERFDWQRVRSKGKSSEAPLKLEAVESNAIEYFEARMKTTHRNLRGIENCRTE